MKEGAFVMGEEKREEEGGKDAAKVFGRNIRVGWEREGKGKVGVEMRGK